MAGFLLLGAYPGLHVLKNTSQISPAVCGTTEILEDQGGSWACIATPNGAGTSGDSINVENDDDSGFFTAMSNANFDDSGDINFIRAAGPPDVLTATVRSSFVPATAIALAANGANCSAGQAPLGVSATGAAEGCFQPFPIARVWYPFPNLSGDASGFPTNDQCSCHLQAIPVKIADLDVISVTVHIPTDANDHVEIGLYSEDGATEYFQGVVSHASAGTKYIANSIGAPSAMFPANYWFCSARDSAATPTASLSSTRPTGTNEMVARFQQACAGGVMPATLTAPTPTFVSDTDSVWFAMMDS